MFIPGTPIAADGATLTEAVAEMVDALRAYAADWIDHLSTAPNHADNWGLVQLIVLSSDEELADWLSAGQLAAQACAGRPRLARITTSSAASRAGRRCATPPAEPAPTTSPTNSRYRTGGSCALGSPTRRIDELRRRAVGTHPA